jgi:predicted MPP superfamily phosphohydrolase
MFHTMLALAFIIPNIYVSLRIGQLFINKGFKLYYSLIYILIASIYPLSNLFSEENTGFLANILTSIANYQLPFYLYLFLFMLVFDVLLLINKLFKIVPSEILKSIRFKITSLSAILFLSLAVVIVGVINFNTIRTSEYRIEIPKKSAKIDHLRIAFVADFHLQERTNIKFVERFVKKIAIIQPDLMVFGGDIVEGDKDDGNRTMFEILLKEIKAKYGSFAVLGNHEFYGGKDKASFFDKAGLKVLCDSTVVIDNSFSLTGRYDSHFSRRKTIGDLLKSVSDSLPVILIDHRPTEIDQVSKTAVDVQLSGHTHDGQLFPINLIINGIYELGWGYQKIGNTHFFVTSGIRLWGPPVRTTGKSEIMVIDITFTDSKSPL